MIAVALLACTVGTAETIQLTQVNTGSSAVVVKDPPDPLAAQSITQNVDPWTVMWSVSCLMIIEFDYQWLRVFDLDGDHGLTGEFCVESVDFAVAEAVGPIQDTTVNVYCLDDGLPLLLSNMDLVGSVVFPQPDAVLKFFNVSLPPGTCCTASSQRMVVRIGTDNCILTGTCERNYIGMNDLGQTAPTYLTTPSCGIPEETPVDLASIGFPDAHLIMVVNGQDEIPPDDDGGDPDVPATTSVGAILLLLILLSSGAYFLGRRVRL